MFNGRSPMMGSASLQVPVATTAPGYRSMPTSPLLGGATAVPISIPGKATSAGYPNTFVSVSPGHYPASLPASTGMPQMSTSPYMSYPQALPTPQDPYLAAYQQPHVQQQAMALRVIPGLPTHVPELPARDLVNYKTAERMFIEVASTRNQYSCWPIHDLYSWYMLCVFGLFQRQQQNTNYVWALGRKGVPPLQQEGYRQWVDKSQLYADKPQEWFKYQFILSVCMFWVYKNYPMNAPAYVASNFDSTM